MGNVYSVKSEVIVFDKSGYILNTSNALFNTSRLVGKNVFDVFEVLNCVKQDIEKLKETNAPLFLPHVAFSCGFYKSICDFVFVKSHYCDEEVFTWMINDNSQHYSCVIGKAEDVKTKTFNTTFSMEDKSYQRQFVR